MAYKQLPIPEIIGQDITLPCNSDLSAAQYKFVKFSSGYIVACSAGDAPLGILQDKPVGTAAKPVGATVRCFGYSKLLMDGTGGSAQDYIKVGTSAVGTVTTTDRDQVGAQLLQDAAANDIAAVLITKFTMSHS